LGYLSSQFSNPNGLMGRVIGHYMALRNRERCSWCVSQMPLDTGEKLLEIGTGPGVALAEIMNRRKDVEVEGIDVSSVMVDQARERNRVDVVAGRVRVCKGSVTRLEFADGNFHRVFTINTTMFWPEPRHDVGEIRRVLKSGGSVHLFLQPRWAKDAVEVQDAAQTLAAWLREAGFEQVESAINADFPPGLVHVRGEKPW
jgi:ubiquinone/menaquinone biosynthesis C-methylase UbiE